MTTRCHSVFSLRSPVALSRQLSDVATLRLAIGRPSCVRRISGSLPRFPTRITLFTLPAIVTLRARNHCGLGPLPQSGQPPHLSRATLYACRTRNPPVHGFSTYSIGRVIVPVLFQANRTFRSSSRYY